ncbi:MAG: metallophosphoesterase [Solobacterium sp.]|nr:metallophosphoesterase [Solobacterium sp.]
MEKPVRIIAVSDNHGLEEPIHKLREVYGTSADYFFHMGDSELPKYMLEGYAAVRGNNDYFENYPNYLVLQIGKYKILLTHGHRDMYWGSIAPLAERAKSMDCQIAFFGHTHVYFDQTVEGVRLLNPGSVWRNRDGSRPTYMIVTLYEGHIEAVRMEYRDLKVNCKTKCIFARESATEKGK